MIKFSDKVDTKMFDISPEEKQEKKGTYLDIKANYNHNIFMRANEKARDISMWEVYHVGKPKPIPPPPLTKKMRPNSRFNLVMADPVLIVDAEPAPLIMALSRDALPPIYHCETYCYPQLGRSENDYLPVLDPKTMTRREIIDYIIKEGYPDFIAGNYPNFTKEDGTYKSKGYLMKHTTIKELYMLYDDIINETHIYC